jgi:OPA family sugar phosphate sensor protein UhpC-like MFS transporter
MSSSIVDFFRTGPDREPIADPAQVRRRYERIRWRVFLGTMVGYGVYYLCRLPLSAAKQPMIDGGVLDEEQLGGMGSALLFTYAFGKLINGFLADKADISRLMSAGLLVSALVCMATGFGSGYLMFAVLWGVNGWFQSMGCAPSVVSLSQWFSNQERGTRYGLWSIAHSLGEGLTFIGTAAVISAWGWRWGFWLPGIVGVAAALALFFVLADRPPTYGLPLVADYKQDYSAGRASEGTVGQQQLAVLRNPAVWVLGLSSALMYVARYAVNNWAILYLQKAKGYSLRAAGTVLSAYPLMAMVGQATSGFVSDRVFHANRHVPALIYGAIEVAMLLLFFLSPPGRMWLDMLALAAFGFSLGGLLVFLGGLMAVDICSKKAAGAAMGFIGLFSYLGAALQDWISGQLIAAGKHVVGGEVVYDFHTLLWFWIGSAALAVALACTTWKVRARE